MRYTKNFTPADVKVHDYTAGYLQDFVGIEGHGRKCTSLMLIALLLFAATWRTSLSDACQRLATGTVGRGRTSGTVGDPAAAEDVGARFNRAFAAQLPKGLCKRTHPLIIDLHETPYYGEPYRDKRELRPGKAKQGTCRFHTFATVYLLSHGRRFTLGMTYVLRDDSLVDVLERLLSQVREIGLRIRYLLLDREFYNVDVVCS